MYSEEKSKILYERNSCDKMMLDLTAKAIALFFKSQDMPCEIIKASKELPFDFILVSVEETEAGERPILQISLDKQKIASDEGVEGFPVNSMGYVHMQFSMKPQIELKDEAVVDLLRFLLLINRTAAFPGFEFSESDRAVFYRYTTIVVAEGIDPYILLTIVANITMVYLSFEKYIKAVANREKTFDQVLEDFYAIVNRTNL
jgi:hypothetical protein